MDATVHVPGSKSITNRALLLAALADGPGTIHRPLISRDTDLMVGAMRALGTSVTEIPGEGTGPDWRVEPASLRGPATVDCGLAGTVMRFVPPMAVLAEGEIDFDGDPRARERPMGPVLSALRDLGATIDTGTGRLPFTVRGRGGLRGGNVQIDASASSQFVSGLLLAAPRYDKGVDVVHVGPPVPSLPHIRMTVLMLRQAGVEIEDEAPQRWRVAPGRIAARDLDVEPDLSNAAPFLAAGLVTGGTVTVCGWPKATTQPGDMLRDLLARMGAECRLSREGLVVRGRGRILGIDADLREVSELAPTLVGIAALASTPSTLRGIGHMRGHETDRLAALATEINNLGGDVTETRDGLTIRPRPLHGGMFGTYADHRMATTGALIGLLVPGVEVEDIATTGKTMPEFVDLWTGMLGARAE